MSNYRVYNKTEVLSLFSDFLVKDTKDNTSNYIETENEYKVIELFAGAGGLAVGMERAELNCVALNDIDKWACQTLRKNHPNWKF